MIKTTSSSNKVRVVAKKITDMKNMEQIEGIVLEYLNITTENIGDGNISKAEIKFNVSKTELSKNNASKEEIVLLRFDEQTKLWEELETRIISESLTQVEYLAETSEFSIFAIAVLEKETEKEEEKEIRKMCQTQRKILKKKTTSVVTDDGKGGEVLGIIVLIIILVALIIGCKIFFLDRGHGLKRE